jgi:hypothetical protein
VKKLLEYPLLRLAREKKDGDLDSLLDIVNNVG